MKTFLQGTLLAVLLAIFGGLQADEAQAQGYGYGYYTNFDEYYGTAFSGSYYPHFYSAGGYGSSYQAQMYPSPMPVPAYVGHTHITYPPLAPHLMMWKHSSWHPMKRTHARYH